MAEERQPEHLIPRIIEREKAQLARIRDAIHESTARLEELREELVAARERSDAGHAEVIAADHGTIVLWLAWLLAQEEHIVARLALLTAPTECDL